ncbi:hypothetical protein TTHERM_000986279 (macronuclear) [Tetrahymena thermophila SB210]|uniref:Uncharacterized protein n=1 Tax=Tetrahymena thermophila (strain SB210) TaxID=312017 RepID=W7XD67_TETTS|nr:hypothetical protein TTHERM_000986279 [Tetrahymena thermophila SB210]EWS75442.1 hypothetical protein TTHERM_000986279 [Tetrahymena thermophila SB210]|eukprot:XP_012652027.1 hypothetical protein TTHERM_000986279 [Tetrahymena thermophila SB210]
MVEFQDQNKVQVKISSFIDNYKISDILLASFNYQSIPCFEFLQQFRYRRSIFRKRHKYQ